MSAELSSQDLLRLNVLLAQHPQAIRIDESRLTLNALLPDGECTVPLHPGGNETRYLRAVREWLSGQVTGSPGGYPVHIRRWTRMGQMRDDNLEQLLLLGEPEAVVAVACARGLNDELARRAWWILQDTDNARHMLRHEAVRGGRMGPELAAFLAAHLPFESETVNIMETCELVLQPGLLDDDSCQGLWQRARRKPVFYVGFLASRPMVLPEVSDPHPGFDDRLRAAADQGVPLARPLAGLLVRMLSGPGQAYLATLRRVLAKPTDQDVVDRLLALVATECRDARPEGAANLDIEALSDDAERWLGGEQVAALGPLGTDLAKELRALRFLSGLGDGVVRPLLGDSTASGSLMRRKLAPALEAIDTRIDTLIGR